MERQTPEEDTRRATGRGTGGGDERKEAYRRQVRSAQASTPAGVDAWALLTCLSDRDSFGMTRALADGRVAFNVNQI